MQQDHYQSVEDFLNDPTFQQWVREGIDENGWSNWIEQKPSNLYLAKDALSIISALGINENKVIDEEIDEALRDTWEKIIIPKPIPKRFTLDQKIRRIKWSVAAAMVIAIAGVGYLRILDKQSSSPSISNAFFEENNVIRHHNKSKEHLLITLTDGSSLLLQPGSEISYFETSDERKLTLSGEAFFEISKNIDKPFFVYANETVTKVVGTSFRVKAYHNQPSVEIIVRTGTVKVFSINNHDSISTQEIALHPNESVKFVRREAIFEKPVIAKPNTEVAIEQLQFDFIDTPVSKIFETIELAYGIDIHYPANLLNNCYLSTSLTDEPLPQKLRIIAESIGGQTSFIIKDDQITIFSNGCN